MDAHGLSPQFLFNLPPREAALIESLDMCLDYDPQQFKQCWKTYTERTASSPPQHPPWFSLCTRFPNCTAQMAELVRAKCEVDHTLPFPYVRIRHTAESESRIVALWNEHHMPMAPAPDSSKATTFGAVVRSKSVDEPAVPLRPSVLFSARTAERERDSDHDSDDDVSLGDY